MVFSSPTFICLFLPLTLAFYFLSPQSAKNAVLVGASIVFYGWGDPVAAFALILPSIVLNFYLGRMLGRAEGPRRRRLLVLAVGINLATLIAFKYSRFIIGNINDVMLLFGASTLRAPEIPLPLGISFFTFHILSYLIDIYRGALPPQTSYAVFCLKKKMRSTARRPTRGRWRHEPGLHPPTRAPRPTHAVDHHLLRSERDE